MSESLSRRHFDPERTCLGLFQNVCQQITQVYERVSDTLTSAVSPLQALVPSLPGDHSVKATALLQVAHPSPCPPHLPLVSQPRIRHPFSLNPFLVWLPGRPTCLVSSSFTGFTFLTPGLPSPGCSRRPFYLDSPYCCSSQSPGLKPISVPRTKHVSL